VSKGSSLTDPKNGVTALSNIENLPVPDVSELLDDYLSFLFIFY